MTSLKYRNDYLSRLKKRVKSLREKQRELDDEVKQFCDAKFFNEQMNNIITTEIIKATKKLSRKYGFNEKEGIDLVIHTKITDATPEDLKCGVTSEFEEEIIEEETESLNVYSQKTINGTKYYIKNTQVYDSLLNVIGTLNSKTQEIEFFQKDI